MSLNRAASRNISALWHAPDTTAQDRKAIVRCLVHHVVVHIEQGSEYVDVTIHWHGDFTSQHQVVRPVFGYTQLRDCGQLIARVKALHQEDQSVPAIAERLNEEGFVPPRRRGEFSVDTVTPILERLGLVGELYRDDRLGSNEWWIHDLAATLKVPSPKVHYGATQGLDSLAQDAFGKALDRVGGRGGAETPGETQAPMQVAQGSTESRVGDSQGSKRLESEHLVGAGRKHRSRANQFCYATGKGVLCCAV